MIKFTYTDQDEGGLQIETKDLLFDSLKFKYVRQTTDKILWEIDLLPNSWARYPDIEMVDVIVEDPEGNEVYRHRWDVMLNGTFLYQKLWKYCLNNPNSKGVVVGTHSGDFGEWVPLINIAEMVLVEASDKQFTDLTSTYSKYQNLTLVNKLVTVDGKDVTFYEGGAGYTNSVVKKVIEYWENEPITSTKRQSIKFTSLITPDTNWIHLDVEGIDDQLLMSLDDATFNHIDLIIYEYNNLSGIEREVIKDFLVSKGYKHYQEGGIGLAEK
mgnify:FL=1